MITVSLDPICLVAPGGLHYRLMDRVISTSEATNYRARCEACDQVIGIDGAKWVAETIVIHEQDAPQDLLDN